MNNKKKTKVILRVFISIAFIINLGLFISEVIEDSLNMGKVIAYLSSIVLTVIMFVFVSRIDKNAN